MANQVSNSPTNLTSNAFTRTGYTFTGWNTASNGSGTSYTDGQSYDFSADMTLYAQWTANNNTLTFDANGGAGAMASQTVATDASITLPGNTFTRAGYTFAGWSTTAGGAVAFANGASYTMGTSNATLFAVWNANTYTVTFNGNGSDGGSMANQNYVTGTTANLTANAFTQTGYTFSGWNTSADGLGTSYANSALYTMGTANVTLFAQWTVYVGPVSKTYKLITNTSELEVGKKYLIVNSNTVGTGRKALSNQQTNFRSLSDDITIVTGSPISITTTAAGNNSNTQPFEITILEGSDATHFYLFDAVNNTYLIPASGGASSNFLNGQILPSDWTITISGKATITNTGHPNTNATPRNLMSYNSGASRFACYSSEQAPIYLYKEDCSTIPADPSSSFSLGTPACGSVELSYTGTIPGGEDYFWQTSATGTATTLPVSSAYTATSTGTYHVRAKIGTCWSNGTASQLVTVSQAPSISTEPANASVVSGNTATFSVVASNASSYQWQVNTGSGWNNVSTGTGATSATYQTENTTSGMNEYFYRVVVGGTSPCTPINSNGLAQLTVSNATVNAISNQSSVYGSTVSVTATATGAVSSWSATLPAGLSINSSGVISGTLTEQVAGSPFASSVTANFTAGGSDTKLFTWTITPKALTVSGLTGSNKEYDGNTTATLSGTGTLVGVVGVDVVSLSGAPSATFVNATVGNIKPITVSGYTISGAQAGNYTLTQPTGITADITPKALTVTGATAQDKVYNGNTTASIMGATLVGVISPDVVTISGGGTFAIADAGIGIAVTASLTLAGAQAGNYNLTQPTGLSANITKANPVFTTSTISITLGGTYSLPGANISSTSDGAFSYTITSGGNATLGGTTITGAVVGSETLTVNQAASANYNAGSTTVAVNVTTINYVNGDYRSLSSGLWNPTGSTGLATWERFNGSVWSASAAPATNTTNNIYIDNGHTVSSGTNVGNNFNVHVLSGGKYVSQHSSTANNVIVYTGGTFELMNNLLRINGVFEIENGATFIYNYSANPGEGLALWNGTERFHPTSNFIVRNANSGSGNYFIPASGTGAGQINSNTYAGVTAFFGNLIIDASIKDVRLTANNLSGATITHGNLEIKSNPIGGGSHSLIYGSLTWTIGGDLIIGQNTIDSGTTGINISSGSNTITWNVKGNFINNSGNTFRIANNATANVTLNVDGDVILNSGTVDLNATTNGQGTVNMKGNFSVATGATYTATQSSTAKTIFSGGNVQNVSGAGTINVHYMEVNKTGGYVNLLRDLQAKIQLTMTQGHVYTNANLLELGESTTQKGTLTHTSGYVVGRMKRWFNGTNSGNATGLFPMGVDESGLKNRFSLIEYTSAPATGGHLTVEFKQIAMGLAGLTIPALSTGGFGYDVSSTENQGYWQIDNQGTLTDGVYTISCTGEGFATITDLSQITLLKRVGGGNWFCQGTHQAPSGSIAVPTAIRSGVSGWSNFGFGAPASVNPLPVELVQFVATCDQDKTNVTWSTASEQNAAYFEVEESVDGINWRVVSKVDAIGNSVQLNSYETELVYQSGTTYYRLNQVDIDGKSTLSGVIVAACGDAAIQVYPNPTNEWIFIQHAPENVEISLLAMDGRKVKQEIVQQAQSGISLQGIEQGTYHLQVRSNGQLLYQTKVVKIDK